MSTEEVDRYAAFNVLVQAYANLESEALPAHLSLESFVQSHQAFTPADLDQTREKLLTLRMYAHIMSHVGAQCDRTLAEALPK